MKAEPAQLRHDLEKLRRHARILVDLGRLSSEAQTLDDFLAQAATQVSRAVEIDHVKILRHRPERDDLFMEAGVGWKEGMVKSTTFGADLQSPAGRAFQTGEPVIIHDRSEADEFRLHPSLEEHGIVSLANVPILIDGAAWGVLEVDGTEPRRFGEDTQNLMLAAGAIIGGAIRRAQSESRQSEALAAGAVEANNREVLLREMQHRVKNNFQIILSIISLRRRRMTSDEGRRALDHIANRINAVSLAHNQLSPSQGMRVIDLDAYLGALCANIQQQHEEVVIRTDFVEQDFSVDRAVPLGLILNELVTNSVKHAFGDGGGVITVRLETGVGRGEARLTVSDDGRGMQEAQPSSSGLKLIQALARQIGGVLETASSGEGVTTSVTFPIIV